MLGAADTYDGTVCDINADGGTDIKDLIKLKKCQANTGAINQSRMFAYSSRFSGLNSAEVPAGHPGRKSSKCNSITQKMLQREYANQDIF